MSKCCVTGSAGRVGRAIYEMLSARGHSVVGLDRTPSSTTDIVADLRDVSHLKRALYGSDAVFHTGALHAPHVGVVSDEEFRSINVIGTELVIKAARESGARHFVLTSTTCLLYTSPSPRDQRGSRMPSSA